MSVDSIILALVAQAIKEERDISCATIDKATSQHQRWYYIGQATAYMTIAELFAKYNADSRALPPLRGG